MKLARRKIVFDGQIYAGNINGMYRYTDEVLREFDKLIDRDEFEIIVPKGVDLSDRFQNIKVIHYGKARGLLWTQICLLLYLLRNRAVSVGFCNVTPLLKPGITVIHDIAYKVLQEQYRNLYGRLSQYWHRLNYWIIVRSGVPVITVSNFSKKQITEVYKVDPKRIVVIANGWQHYSRIGEDDSIFTEIPVLQKGNYFFSLGSLEERKNFKWVVETAKRNREEYFVVAGGDVRNARNKPEFDKIPNLIFLGYISDERAKSLMRNCKAFLFPSTFEGFGIPPLEALSVRTKVVCAHAASLPEICGEAVIYVEPDQYDLDLKMLDGIDQSDRYEEVLSRYSWERSAQQLYDFLKKYSLRETGEKQDAARSRKN